MKKLKIILCGILLSFASLAFFACGPQDFKEEDIVFSQTTFTYDGNSHIFNISYKDVELTTEYSLDGEIFVDKDSITIRDAGNYTVYFKISADGFNEYVGQKEVVINNANFDAELFAISNQTITYNGYANIFSVGYPNIEINNVLYSCDEGADKTWKTKQELNLINPGEYQVYFKVSFANYNDYISENPVTLTINSLDWGDKVEAFNTNPVTYDGESHMFNLRVNGTSNFNAKYRLKGEENWRDKTELNLVNAGTYQVEYKVSANGYSQDFIGEQTFVINKATLQSTYVSLTNTNTVSFDANAHMFDVNVNSSVAGAKVLYSIDNGTTWKERNQISFVDAGSYIVKFKIQSKNYQDFEAQQTYTIAPISFDLLKIKATNPIFTYDGNAKTFTANYTGNILGGATVKVEYQVDNGAWQEEPISRTDVCEISVKYRLSAKNYITETSNAITFVIQEASFEGLVETTNLNDVEYKKARSAYIATYDGNAKMFGISVMKDETPIDAITIKYSLDNQTWTDASEFSITEIGEYKVYYQISKPNYKTFTDYASLVIYPAKFDESKILINGIVTKNFQLTFNGTEQKPVVTYDDNINYTVQYSLDNSTWRDGPLGYKDVGMNYKIYFKLSEEKHVDYKGFFYFCINKAEFDIEKISRSAQIVYDGKAHSFVVSYDKDASFGEEVTVEYKISGENWTTEPPTKTEVGEYNVIYRLKANNFETFESAYYSESNNTNGTFIIYEA